MSRAGYLTGIYLHYQFLLKNFENMGKGKGGKPSTTGKPSGGGRDNNPPKK